MWTGLVLGAGTGIGVVMVALSLRPIPPGPTSSRTSSRWGMWLRQHYRRFVLCVAVGVVVWWATGWPVAAVAGAGLAWASPVLFGPDRRHQREVANVEAVAAWTESLRDTLAAAAGLEQAIAATANHAPPAIKTSVKRLADGIAAGGNPAAALRAFAAELDDETCDLVAVSLTLAAERQAGNLAPLLSTLADTARAQAALRMRVAAGRARIRTATRVITITTVSMAAGLIAFDAGFLDPYNGTGGQVALAVVAGLFAFGLWWLYRLAKAPLPPRLLKVGSP